MLFRLMIRNFNFSQAACVNEYSYGIFQKQFLKLYFTYYKNTWYIQILYNKLITSDMFTYQLRIHNF